MYEQHHHNVRPTVQLPSFDDMLHMARHQPEELEKLRQHLCQQVIASAPPKGRAKLEGLQFRIDAQRRLSQSPIGACVRISRMMNAALQDLCDVFNDPHTKRGDDTAHTNNVIPLFKRQSQ